MQLRRKGGCACLRRGDTCPLGKWNFPSVDAATGLTRQQWDSRPQWWKNRHPWIDSAPKIESQRSLLGGTPSDLKNFFDAVWCINLDASRQRWSDFTRQLAACDWPFGPVRRFSAVHGDAVGVPDHFHQGGGAWGCLQSHRRVLEKSLVAHHRRILVMEDDADLRPHFGRSVRQFLADLGDEPWDCLMLGGQHMSTPIVHKPGVVRPAGKGIQRTHCMAMAADFMRELYRMWSGLIDQHCDWALGPFAAKFRTFAPARFIVGQRGGKSLIAGSEKPPEWWNPPPPDAPVIWLRAPRQVLESCRDIFHSGYRRSPRGYCVGLAAIFGGSIGLAARVDKLRRWIATIQWECASRDDGSVCTIWHPQADEATVRAATNDPWIVNAQTETEARTQFHS